MTPLDLALKELLTGDWVKSRSGKVVEVSFVQDAKVFGRKDYVAFHRIVEVRKASSGIKVKE